MYLLMLLMLLLYGESIAAFGKGAPGDEDKNTVTVCEDIFPQHFNSTEQPSNTNPFNISTSLPICRDHQLVMRVVISSTQTELMGFVVQAIDANQTILGSFNPSHTPNTKLTCQNTSLTQTKRLKDKEVEVEWLVPEGFRGAVTMRAILLQNVTVFWKTYSDEITIVSQQTSCGCAGVGRFVCANNDCVVEWWKEGSQVNFRLERRLEGLNNYIAVGLSLDQNMGDDLVMYCYHSDTQVKVAAGVTKGYSFTDLLLSPKDIIMVSHSFSSTHLFCHFSTSFSFQTPLSLKPLQQHFFLLVASGIHSEGHIQKHGALSISSHPIELSTATCISPSSSRKTSFKIHGVLMCVAWMLCASLCILLPRHFRFPTPPIFSKPPWFLGHQVGMATTMLLTCTSVLVVFLTVGSYSQATGVAALHPIMGLSVTILVIANPIMALFRCAPTARHRSKFNRGHQLVGMTTHVLASLTLFLAPSMGGVGLAWWWRWVVLAHALWHLTFDLGLYLITFRRMRRISKDSAENIEMRNEATSKTQNPLVSNPFLLLVHFGVIFILTSTSIVGVILAT